MASLNFAVNSSSGQAPYPQNVQGNQASSIHPDVPMYPGTGTPPIGDIADGTSHTIICVETVDNQHSVGCWARHATLVGLSLPVKPRGPRRSGRQRRHSRSSSTPQPPVRRSGSTCRRASTGSFDDLGNIGRSLQGSQNSSVHASTERSCQFNFSPTRRPRRAPILQFQTGNQQVTNLQLRNDPRIPRKQGRAEPLAQRTRRPTVPRRAIRAWSSTSWPTVRCTA